MDYTDLYDFQTSTGIIVPDDKSVLLGIQKKFQEIFGTDIDLSAETPVGRLIEAMAVVVKSTLGVTAQTANQFNVNLATGVYLDAIAQIYDLKRIAGTRTRISIRVYFSQGTTDSIPAGSLIMSSVNGEMFAIDGTINNTGLVDSDGRFYAEGSATAVNDGPIVAGEGTVTSIQTTVLGWTGVTNVSPTYIGTNVETDEAFRKRIIESRPVGIGFMSHLESALNRLDGVYSVCILENNTGSSLVKQGIILPPHYIFVGVDCIATDDLYKSIAEQIARAKPIGTGMVNPSIVAVKGGTPVEISVPYGFDGTETTKINFYKADRTAILVDLTYRIAGYAGSNIGGDISDVVAEYVNSIGVGGTVYASMIAKELITKLDIGVENIVVQASGRNTYSGSIAVMNGYETPYSSAEFVTATEATS